MKQFVAVISVFAVSCVALSAQELTLSVSDRPLGEVLNSLNIEISFDSKALSAYRITLSRKFASPAEAIEYLLRDKPFVYERIGNVYVISEKPKRPENKPPKPPRDFFVSGIVTDGGNGECLPYAHIQTSKGMITSDGNGLFSVRLTENHPITAQIRYLGYATCDTVLAVRHHQIRLSPAPVLMGEVVVSPSPSVMMLSGATSGEIRLNHAVAQNMAGSSDNSVFNLLRMMPGVRASGEPSDELMVWGSKNGESNVVYDGFTLYGLQSFSEDISFINPYLVKDIRLMKGGYGARFGNRVGAVTEMTGINGNKTKPELKANLSNLTANLFASVPVTKRSTLMAGYRQTFYNLYDIEKLNPYKGQENTGSGKGKDKGNGNDNGNGNGSGNGNENNNGNVSGNDNGNGQSENRTTNIFIRPDFVFRDANIRFSGNISQKDNYFISLYGASDDFDFSVSQSDDLSISASEEKTQLGGSAFYNRVWNNGSNTSFLFSASHLQSEYDHVTRQGNRSQPELIHHNKNSILEINAKAEHRMNLGERQQLEIGGEFTRYRTSLNRNELWLNKPSLFVTDNFLFNKLTFSAGIRADYVTDGKLYVHPRLSGRYAFSETLTATASWGLYRQYVANIPVEDASGDVDFAWQALGDNSTASTHVIAGIAYARNGLLAGIEGFYRKNDNAVRFSEEIYETDIDITGFDLFLRKEWKKILLFGSYSLLDVSEKENETGHELKLGTVVTLSSFAFSANYVFGTGFSYLSRGSKGTGQDKAVPYSNTDYNRLDIGAYYNATLKWCRIRAGLSVINLLGSENVKYGYRISVNKDVTNVYTKTASFTPMLSVGISF